MVHPRMAEKGRGPASNAKVAKLGENELCTQNEPRPFSAKKSLPREFLAKTQRGIESRVLSDKTQAKTNKARVGKTRACRFRHSGARSRQNGAREREKVFS
jgi:hypothetical protein